MAHLGGLDFLFLPLGGFSTAYDSGIAAQTIGLTIGRRGASATVARRATSITLGRRSTAAKIDGADLTVALED